MHFAIKVALSALIVAGSSELAKRNPAAGAVLVSLPLSSVLALGWLWAETGDPAQVAAFSWGILWALVPSVALLAALPLLMRWGLSFWPSLAVSAALTAGAYAGWARLAGKFGFRI